DMLTNANFGSGTNTFSTTGWTGDATLGGLKSYMCAERYQSTVDFYQTVKDAPAGIYSIETHAFVRPAGNGNYDGTETINCWLYMNDFKTTVQNIVADGLPIDQAVTGENSFLDNTVLGEYYGGYPGVELYDYKFVGEKNGVQGEYYVPNGMIGASYAFGSGRYSVKTYGLVGDGEDMKLGITSQGNKVEWFLFSGFKLVYEGKSAKAIYAILPTYTQNLLTFVENNSVMENNMTEPYIETANKAITEASKLTENDESEDLWNALINVNAAMASAEENVSIYKEFIACRDSLVNTADKYYENAKTSAKEEYDAIKDIITSAEVNSWNNDQLKEYLPKMRSAKFNLELPNTETASDDNPVNATKYIINYDIENGENGWTYTKKGGNGPILASGSGVEGTQSIEFWNGSATALNFDIYQTINNLPAGTYALTVQAAHSLNDVAAATYQDEEGNTKEYEGHVYLYAQVGDVLNADSIKVQSEAATNVSNHTIYFNIPEGQNEVKIGLSTFNTTCRARWFVADNFSLEYYGTNSAYEATGDKDQVDIENVDSNAAEVVAIYSVSGAMRDKLENGINIVKMSDGTVKKVMKK
ncbi:MAG: hypothetical protein K6E54_09610, partial [Bacteroidaceae bacterium]|nr:hypothetical protein [Bacteroidaceae bacterium]